MNLPPLPDPDGTAEANKVPHSDGGYEFNEIPAWSEALVRAYAAEAVRVALEEAANLAESWSDYSVPKATGPRIARAIRALIPKD